MSGDPRSPQPGRSAPLPRGGAVRFRSRAR
nr:MAG TPA: hypothetical protein [Caudoviricetes sp.]